MESDALARVWIFAQTLCAAAPLFPLTGASLRENHGPASVFLLRKPFVFVIASLLVISTIPNLAEIDYLRFVDTFDLADLPRTEGRDDTLLLYEFTLDL